MGESGPVSRQRDYVAPFPEAQVSFGLPPKDGPDGAGAADSVRPAAASSEPGAGAPPEAGTAAVSWFGGEHGPSR